MKKIKILFYILIYIMLIGGIMGLIKGFAPQLQWFNFRYLLGIGSTFKAEDVHMYATVYGIFMATLEIISSILLLSKKSFGIKFAIITLTINSFVCIIAIFLGDIIALGSLLIRFFAIYILIKFKSIYQIKQQY